MKKYIASVLLILTASLIANAGDSSHGGDLIDIREARVRYEVQEIVLLMPSIATTISPEMIKDKRARTIYTTMLSNGFLRLSTSINISYENACYDRHNKSHDGAAYMDDMSKAICLNNHRLAVQNISRSEILGLIFHEISHVLKLEEDDARYIGNYFAHSFDKLTDQVGELLLPFMLSIASSDLNAIQPNDPAVFNAYEDMVKAHEKMSMDEIIADLESRLELAKEKLGGSQKMLGAWGLASNVAIKQVSESKTKKQLIKKERKRLNLFRHCESHFFWLARFVVLDIDPSASPKELLKDAIANVNPFTIWIGLLVGAFDVATLPVAAISSGISCFSNNY